MNDEKPYRRANQPLTPEEISRIDRALEMTKGQRTAAAELLGVPPSRVHDSVRDHEFLRAKWTTKSSAPPVANDATDIDRSPVNAFDEATAKALDKQDALMVKTKGKLPGFKPEEQALIVQITKAYANQYRFAADLTHSGAVHATNRLLLLIEQLTARAEAILANPGKYDRVMEGKGGITVTKSANDYYKETTDQIIKTAEALRKMNETVQRGTEIRMRIERMKQQGKDTPKRIAGWEPGKTLDADSDAK